jgi:hypothetical protein
VTSGKFKLEARANLDSKAHICSSYSLAKQASQWEKRFDANVMQALASADGSETKLQLFVMGYPLKKRVLFLSGQCGEAVRFVSFSQEGFGSKKKIVPSPA